MQVIVVGSGKLARELLGALPSGDAGQVVPWAAEGLPAEKSVVVHAGSGRELQAVSAFCESTCSPLVELATGSALEHVAADFPVVLCPNTNLLMLKFMAMLERSGLPADVIGEVIMGQVLAAGVGQNPARQAMMKAGVAKETPALTINAVCGSGLKAVMLAAQAVAATVEFEHRQAGGELLEDAGRGVQRHRPGETGSFGHAAADLRGPRIHGVGQADHLVINRLAVLYHQVRGGNNVTIGYFFLQRCAGLIQRNLPGARKSGRQATFSSDILYDTLLRHDPDHLLLRLTREEAMRGLVDFGRLEEMLAPRSSGRLATRSSLESFRRAPFTWVVMGGWWRSPGKSG